MYYYGEYNPDETEAILSLAKGTCLDIGANIGVISQALLANDFQVVAFEPQPEIFKLLELNCASAAKTISYQVFNTAVGSEPGTAKMPKVHYSAKGNFGGLGIGTPSYLGNIEVPVVTIDSFNFVDVGFMKIDVEGYEYEVLLGATETIDRCKPTLYIEDDRQDKSRALRQYIYDLGYEIEEHRPTLYRENNFFGLKKNVWDRNYASHNLVCKPR
jgi:FkbM family methyltransferase